MFNKLLSLSLIALLASCCAMGKKTEPVWVTSYPEEAEVVIDGHFCGTTPVCVELNKKHDHTIELCKEGYHCLIGTLPSSHTLKSSKNIIWPIAGAVIGTGIGLACCGTSGAILPEFIVGTVLGTGIGSLIGVSGAIVDCAGRSDCSLPPHFHGEMVQK